MLMFRAILHQDLPQLSNIGTSFARRDGSRPRLAATLLCLDLVFADPLKLHSSSPSEIADCFERFLVYARALQRLSCLPDPCSNSEVGKLFAFDASREEHLSVSMTSYIISEHATSLSPSTSNFPDVWDTPRWELEKLIKGILQNRLLKKVSEENEICHTLHNIQPCLLSAVYNRCPKRWCPDYHVDVMGDVSVTYNTLIRINMLQIMIYHTLYATELPFEKLEGQQRYAFIFRVAFSAFSSS